MCTALVWQKFTIFGVFFFTSVSTWTVQLEVESDGPLQEFAIFASLIERRIEKQDIRDNETICTASRGCSSNWNIYIYDCQYIAVWKK